MAAHFTSKRPLPNSIPPNGTIRRVTKNPFASGDDVVACSSFSLCKCLNIGNIKELNSGDIVKIFPDGRIIRLWDATSFQNCLFITNCCNFRCLMCPQPPCADNPEQHKENLRILDLMDSKVEMIGITGGEPTLFPERLIDYFDVINRKFPTARVEILTNGSPLSNFVKAKSLALAAPLDICYCVSIHGDTGSLAESIMRCDGGWDKALQGINNLAKLQQQIEIRVVVTKNNASYLEDIAVFLYRNFPFVYHIAFMGQEITGEAVKNYSEIWVEPMDYAASLDRAVRYLAAMDMNVSIYNIPHCLILETSRKFAARSISDWKQAYIEQCEGCMMKSDCCGFFTTSGKHYPRGIAPSKSRCHHEGAGS